MFNSLSLREWRQFRSVDVTFHPRLTVLTGANGAGKTTILNLLNRHFGWSIMFLSTPVTRRGALSYFSGRFDEVSEQDRTGIGELRYRDGTVASLVVPPTVSQQYDVKIQNQRPVSGIFLPSHRPVYSYQRVDQIPTTMDASNQLLEGYLANLRGFWAANARVTSPSVRLKQSLISLATFGFGNEVVERNSDAIEVFEGFQDALRAVLPPKLGFERIAIRMPEVVLECSSGDFSIDAASGGVAALVDVAWQIYLRSVVSTEFVVVADEPENHLHPELQRALLPGLLDAFPQAQFIVATHNPFVVGSVPDSNVYVLDFIDQEDGTGSKVESQLLDLVNKGGTSNEILREALGVPMPTPIWVEDALRRISELLDEEEVDVDQLQEAKRQLTELGLERYLPSVLAEVERDPTD